MGAMTDINDMSYWYPKLEEAGLPVPRTMILHTDAELMSLLDGMEPEPPGSLEKLADEIVVAASAFGDKPFFLRTGHTSGKHDWQNTCYVAAVDRDAVLYHIVALVEHSALAGIMGLPTQTWVVRELIRTEPQFYCLSYGNFPVVREFRVFARDGKVEEIYPYWPEKAVEHGKPDAPNWKHILREISTLEVDEHGRLCALASEATLALGGFWSIDFLQDENGTWWLTDCADGDQSYRPGADE
jgi:hypothetical protein